MDNQITKFRLSLLGKVGSEAANVATELRNYSNVEAERFQILDCKRLEHLISVDVVVEKGVQHPLAFVRRYTDEVQILIQIPAGGFDIG